VNRRYGVPARDTGAPKNRPCGACGADGWSRSIEGQSAPPTADFDRPVSRSLQ